MTTTKYAADITSAREMIAEAGTIAPHRRIIPGSYDPITGNTGPATITIQDVFIVIFPVVPSRDDTFEDATFKRTHHRHLYLALKTNRAWEPEAGDHIYFEKKWWVIPGGSALRPDGALPILFELVVEG